MVGAQHREREPIALSLGILNCRRFRSGFEALQNCDYYPERLRRMPLDEEDPQTAEYLGIVRVFLPGLLSRLREGAVTPPVEVVLSDTGGAIGSWQVDGFGKFTDLMDTEHVLRRVQYPVEVIFTDRNGQAWTRRIEEKEVV
jgi:hypothetical protein